MDIMKFLQKKKDKNNQMDCAESAEKAVEEKVIKQFAYEPKYVPNLSFFELQEVDWEKFAGLLKKEGVLSASYDKNPTSIEYSLAKDNTPMVELTFSSKTSQSVRKVQLFNDKAYLFVNDAIEAFPETQRNKDLNRVWKNFKEELKYISYLNTNREAYFHKLKAERMKKTAERMEDTFTNFYAKEREFLEANQNAKFCDFGWKYLGYPMSMVYAFTPLMSEEKGIRRNGEQVVPFSPRTLEFCILNMTDNCKIYEGEFLTEFEKKCRQIQEYSCFESEDWDRVIDFGKKIVRNRCIEYMITHEMGEN